MLCEKIFPEGEDENEDEDGDSEAKVLRLYCIEL